MHTLRKILLGIAMFLCAIYTVSFVVMAITSFSNWKLSENIFSFFACILSAALCAWLFWKARRAFKAGPKSKPGGEPGADTARKTMAPETAYRIKIGVSAAAAVAGVAMIASSDEDLFEAGPPLLMFGLIFMLVFWRSHSKRTKREQAAAAEAALQARIAEVGAMTELPVLEPYAIVTHAGEVCHYQAAASVLIIKNQVVGRTGGSGGVSVRVAKGLTLHSGRGASQAIRKDIPYTYPGILTITNQRMIMTGEKGFEYPLMKITSMVPYNRYDGIILQFGRSTFTLLMDEPFAVPKILELIGAKHSIQEN